MVQKALFEHFLVQTRPVEADIEAALNIGNQSRVCRSGHDAVGIVTLVKHGALEKRLAVDFDFEAVNPNASQAGVAGRAVNRSSGGVKKRDV